MIDWIDAKTNPPKPDSDKFYLVWFDGGWEYGRYVECQLNTLHTDGTITLHGEPWNSWKVGGLYENVEYYAEVNPPC